MISPTERVLMHHALGLDQHTEAYRNRFHVETHPEWESLVARGLAYQMPSRRWYNKITKRYESTRPFYYVSAAGLDELALKERGRLEGYELGTAPTEEEESA